MSTRLSLLILLAAAGSAGCETFGPNQCDDSLAANPPMIYTGGTTQDGVYMSSPWTGPLLAFPGGQRYTLTHLPSQPAWILTYLSFDVDGTADGGSLAQSTGNQAEVVGGDDTTLQIANDSCSSYYLLVVAGVGAAPPSPQ